jgi:hypothetical protein
MDSWGRHLFIKGGGKVQTVVFILATEFLYILTTGAAKQALNAGTGRNFVQELSIK